MSSYGWGRIARGLGVCGVATGLIAATSPSAFAQQPDQVGFTTYLRDGPGVRYRPTDEVLSGTRVTVLGCENGWCRVQHERAGGYLAQSSLMVEPEQRALTSPSCFQYREAGYHGGREVEICAGRPVTTPAPTR